ncbi:MAG TPA: hypothetical protein VFU36_04805 [Jatrophihabitans sp.]|nr:hypothetical protein [Jatrophihabitans sp.]
MRNHGMRQSHAYLEQMLDGGLARQDALAKLMAAARKPDRPDPAGLAAALAEFRAVSAARPATPVRRSSKIKSLATRMLAAKFLTATGLALAATGGIAAASTGHLPSPLPHSSHASGTAVAAVASHALPTSSSSDSASSSTSASASAEPSSTDPAAPAPSLRGLCQAWQSRPHEHGKADTSPAFSFLVSTAGGTDAVDGYCSTLLSSAPGEPSSTPTASHPDESTRPSGRPSTVPSPSHPDGKPSTVPSPSHSAGKPSPLPTPSRH